MAKYIFDVPPRLDKKKGILGTFENKDVFIAGGLALLGIVFALAINGVIGLSLLVICFLMAWLGFLQPITPYGDNVRKYFKKMFSFNKSQKIYYFRRSRRNS